MADDIIDRLRCAYRKGDEPPCEACTFCAARAEIERLRAAILEWDASTDCFWDDADSHDAAVQRYRAARAAAVKAARRG